MNRCKNQVVEIKQVNHIKKAAKKDVKMKVSPTMSFGINKTRQVETSDSRLATMFMKTKVVSGKTDRRLFTLDWGGPSQT